MSIVSEIYDIREARQKIIVLEMTVSERDREIKKLQDHVQSLERQMRIATGTLSAIVKAEQRIDDTSNTRSEA